MRPLPPNTYYSTSRTNQTFSASRSCYGRGMSRSVPVEHERHHSAPQPSLSHANVELQMRRQEWHRHPYRFRQASITHVLCDVARAVSANSSHRNSSQSFTLLQRSPGRLLRRALHFFFGRFVSPACWFGHHLAPLSLTKRCAKHAVSTTLYSHSIRPSRTHGLKDV